METLTSVPALAPELVELRTLFLAAMRNLAATITLVTTCEEGRPHGMAATAVCSLSADPPALLACVKRTASLHGPVSRARWFCINLLGQQHGELFREFTHRQGAARFEVGEWSAGPHQLPCLSDAVATLICCVQQQVDFGTHTIFIGTVTLAQTASRRAPLLYQDGSVGQFVACPAEVPRPSLRLGNIIYTVRELDRAVRFYRDVLGLPLKFTDNSGWAAFDAGGATLALEQAASVAQGQAIRASLKLSGDLEEFVSRLRAAGAQVGEIRTGAHERIAVVTDPDGNQVTLYVPR